MGASARADVPSGSLVSEVAQEAGERHDDHRLVLPANDGPGSREDQDEVRRNAKHLDIRHQRDLERAPGNPRRRTRDVLHCVDSLAGLKAGEDEDRVERREVCRRPYFGDRERRLWAAIDRFDAPEQEGTGVVTAEAGRRYEAALREGKVRWHEVEHEPLLQVALRDTAGGVGGVACRRWRRARRRRRGGCRCGTCGRVLGSREPERRRQVLVAACDGGALTCALMALSGSVSRRIQAKSS